MLSLPAYAPGTLAFVTLLVSLNLPHPQNPADSSSAHYADFTADYPSDRAGVLIRTTQDWQPVSAAMPAKTRAKHGVAASLSYGTVRAEFIADYSGAHAGTQIDSGQFLICICHMISLPGDPLLVKLHPQKDMRELDGGKLPVIGTKTAEATQNDLIPAEVAHPESTVWLVRPLQPLPSGEYALMLGSQNISIFPFTVSAASSNSSATPK